ncbi:hypothetical protein GCM10010510_21020 [Streptomyces anandii JCM 4720]|nr:hypothetical protein GCM10010510_21020 [Streptomyces anandii JCM 4720]
MGEERNGQEEPQRRLSIPLVSSLVAPLCYWTAAPWGRVTTLDRTALLADGADAGGQVSRWGGV